MCNVYNYVHATMHAFVHALYCILYCISPFVQCLYKIVYVCMAMRVVRRHACMCVGTVGPMYISIICICMYLCVSMYACRDDSKPIGLLCA